MASYSLSDYIKTSPFDQDDLAELLNFLVTHIESEKKYPIPFTLDEIQVTPPKKLKKNPLVFSILCPDHLDLDSMKEPDKIRPICEIILSYFRKKPKHSFKKIYEKLERDPEVIKELKSLLKASYTDLPVLNFKYFCKRVKDIYKLFRQENVFHFGADNNLVSPRNSSQNERKKVELRLCNFCARVSLEPMLHLNACDCWFHKQCLETTIISTIESKELKSDFELIIPCSNIHNHLCSQDLEILVEIERARFTLSKPLIMMIKYYYLYWIQDVSHYCNCNSSSIQHTRVDKLTKRPAMLCNGKCSFCGERWEKECPKYAKALNWSY